MNLRSFVKWQDKTGKEHIGLHVDISTFEMMRDNETIIDIDDHNFLLGGIFFPNDGRVYRIKPEFAFTKFCEYEDASEEMKTKAMPLFNAATLESVWGEILLRGDDITFEWKRDMYGDDDAMNDPLGTGAGYLEWAGEK